MIFTFPASQGKLNETLLIVGIELVEKKSSASRTRKCKKSPYIYGASHCNGGNVYGVALREQEAKR